MKIDSLSQEVEAYTKKCYELINIEKRKKQTIKKKCYMETRKQHSEKITMNNNENNKNDKNVHE